MKGRTDTAEILEFSSLLPPYCNYNYSLSAKSCAFIITITILWAPHWSNHERKSCVSSLIITGVHLNLTSYELLLIHWHSFEIKYCKGNNNKKRKVTNGNRTEKKNTNHDQWSCMTFFGVFTSLFLISILSQMNIISVFVLALFSLDVTN